MAHGLRSRKLDVYRLAVLFSSSWVGERLEGSLKNSRTSATQQLDEASGAITDNIAEGNGKRSRTDRCPFLGIRLDIARGSALEGAACLDTLVARKRIVPSETEEGKQLLERIVSMLWRMIESQPSHPDHGTKISTSTMTMASTSTSPSTSAALPKRDRWRQNGFHLFPDSA
jgi:four helix bundle protein